MLYFYLKPIHTRSRVCCLSILLLLSMTQVYAQSAKSVVKKAESLISNAAAHSARIDALEEQEQQDLLEYRTLILQIDALQRNIDQYQQVVKGQSEEIISLKEQIARVEDIKGHLFPLLGEQVTALERFIELDIPFLETERLERIEGLKNALKRSDLSDAEKYRIVSDAYQIEIDYGRTLQAYRGKAPASSNEDKPLSVDYLRIGRLGWYYRTIDKSATFSFDKATSTWVRLPASTDKSIDLMFAVARKERLPEYLSMPLSSKES